jgi:hypothetical protein
MGIIINISNGVTHYASINRNTILIEKITAPVHQTDDDGNILYDEGNGGAPLLVSQNALIGYHISGTFSVWSDETAYRNADDNQMIYEKNIDFMHDTVPVNAYELLYNNFKETVQNYTDDI